METWAFQRACRKVYFSKWNHMTQSLSMFLAATSPVRGKGVGGTQNYSQHAANWKFIMVFAHLGKLRVVLCFFAVINTVYLDPSVWRDRFQTTSCPFTAAGFCVYIVYKDVERLLSNTIEGQRHHVSLAIVWPVGVCTTWSSAKSKYLPIVWRYVRIYLFGKRRCW